MPDTSATDRSTPVSPVGTPQPRDHYVRDVFLEPIMLENQGHVGNFWSGDDRQRFSFCECSCGWSNDTPSANRMLDLWRDHLNDDGEAIE